MTLKSEAEHWETRMRSTPSHGKIVKVAYIKLAVPNFWPLDFEPETPRF